MKLCVKAGMSTQSRLSAVIIRLCRLCPTEIDVKVNLFQICDPRGEVAATPSQLVSQRQTESRFRLRRHVKSGSNYHCCSNICISESDKLLTLCDILTVSPAVQLSRQTHLTRDSFWSAASEAAVSIKKLQKLELCRQRHTLKQILRQK